KLAIAISVLHLFGEHINQKYPKLRASFVEVLETFQGVIEDEFS
ncbi:DNA-binding protein, partial [Salmonella enterica]|nr:DNA-binding protein [Salmonella enterica]